MKKLEGFSIKNCKTEELEIPAKSSGRRAWQVRAFEQLKDAPHMILSAPMGSGKSYMMCYLSAFKMRENPNLRCIISVPQEIIAPGFVQAQLSMPGGELIEWRMEMNLCLGPTGRSKAQQLINWLRIRDPSLTKRVLLCTHSTLLAAYKTIVKEDPDLLEDLLLWIDEAHHVKNGCFDEQKDIAVTNGLGRLVEFALNQSHKKLYLGLTTATLFRGDRHSLLTPDMSKKFEKFVLPYDEHLHSLEHLKTFNYSFLLCGFDYIEGVEKVLKQRRGKDIVYIPHTVSRYSTGNKCKEVEDIVGVYEKLYGQDGVLRTKDVIVLKDGHSEFKILDLVDADRLSRCCKKNYVLLAKDNPKALDAVIAMGMFKEGADLPYADRSIIIGPRSSMVDLIQMIGRLLRDFPGKEHVSIIHLLPFAIENQRKGLKENLNDFLKAVFCSMILEDILRPIQLRDATLKAGVTDKADENPRALPLIDLIPEAAVRPVVEAATKLLIELSEQYGSDSTHQPAMYEAYQKGIPAILKRYNIEGNTEEIGERIWKMLQRRGAALQGTDVEGIRFDAIKHIHPLEGLLVYSSGAFGIDSFRELRKAIDTSKTPLTEELILSWSQQHIQQNEKPPTQKSGPVEFAEGDLAHTTWQDVDNSLKKGLRGLPGGDTLPAFLERKLGVKGRRVAPCR